MVMFEAIEPMVSFTSIAKDRSIGAWASIVVLFSPFNTKFSSLELEALSHAYVQLFATKPYVEFAKNKRMKFDCDFGYVHGWCVLPSAQSKLKAGITNEEPDHYNNNSESQKQQPLGIL